MTDPVDAYLAGLRERLRDVRVDAERLSEEVEGHLRDVQDELVATGMTPGAAAEEAIRRVGDARAVTAALPPRRPARWATAGRGVAIALLLVGAGALLESLGGAAPDGWRWSRLAAGLVGLGLAEAMVLRERWPAAGAHTHRRLVVALAGAALGCTAAGLVLTPGAWIGTAAAAALGAAGLVVGAAVAGRAGSPRSPRPA